jgi:anti-sigma regulatory factor (Ser/Thr protein kinase)
MRGDFPLSHDLPSKICVDCTRLLQPIHPMFGVRLRVFVDWHLHKGREVTILPPSNPSAKRLFRAMQVDASADVEDEDEDAVLPVTRLDRHNEAEEVARRTQEILEYQLTDVSSLGQAAFMAVAELCDNAMDHGKNSVGAYVAVQRATDPRRQVSIAISDLGMGIPEHIRQRYPEWSDDSAAIAHATESSITGTGDPHRGIGFSAVMEAALTASLHAARMNIYSANGFFRLQIVQESRKPEIFPASNYRRGTWITYDLVSV